MQEDIPYEFLPPGAHTLECLEPVSSLPLFAPLLCLAPTILAPPRMFLLLRENVRMKGFLKIVTVFSFLLLFCEVKGCQVIVRLLGCLPVGG